MLILSQDKKSIYNFNNIKSVDVIENEVYITDDILADTGTLIGYYQTEERAKEVLQEMIEFLDRKSFVAMDKEGITIQVLPETYRRPEK